MPDLMDHEQEAQMRDLEEIQRRARMPEMPAQPRHAFARPICGCGTAIDKRRLDALPHVTTCVDCARADEALAARYRRG